MISALVFLIIGGAFIVTLFKGLFSLISTDLSESGLSGGYVFNLFKLPLICFLLLMIYVIWGIPFVESIGYK